MAETLDLQHLDLVETPAEEYRSTNSLYACARLSHLSVGC